MRSILLTVTIAALLGVITVPTATANYGPATTIPNYGPVTRGGQHKCHGQVGDAFGGWKKIRVTGLNCSKAKRVLERFLRTNDIGGWTQNFNGPREVFTKNEKRISGIPLGD